MLFPFKDSRQNLDTQLHSSTSSPKFSFLTSGGAAPGTETGGVLVHVAIIIVARNSNDMPGNNDQYHIVSREK